MIYNGFSASGVVEFTIPASDFSWMRPVVGIVPAANPSEGKSVYYTPLIVAEWGELLEVDAYKDRLYGVRPGSVYLPHVAGPITNGPHV